MLKTPPYESEVRPIRQFDFLLATKVMGWEQWQNGWYTPWIQPVQARHFRYEAGIYSTADTLQLAAVLFALQFKNIEIPWKSKRKPRLKAV